MSKHQHAHFRNLVDQGFILCGAHRFNNKNRYIPHSYRWDNKRQIIGGESLQWAMTCSLLLDCSEHRDPFLDVVYDENNHYIDFDLQPFVLDNLLEKLQKENLLGCVHAADQKFFTKESCIRYTTEMLCCPFQEVMEATSDCLGFEPEAGRYNYRLSILTDIAVRKVLVQVR